MSSSGGAVTITCGAQGPQGPPGPTGFPIAAVLPIVADTSLTQEQNSTLFTNTGASGAVNAALPPVPSPFIPLAFSLLVTVAQPFSFSAPSGVTLQNGNDQSSAGGSITSSTIGNMVTIVMVSATLWIVTNIVGVWDLE